MNVRRGPTHAGFRVVVRARGSREAPRVAAFCAAVRPWCDLRVGGEYQARLFASGWEGTGRIEACEPRKRLLVVTKDADASEEQEIEITLTADGDGTVLVWEERGMPVDLAAAYGAGVQVH